MSYPRIFERVYGQPLCITAQHFYSIHSFLLPRMMGETALEIPSAADQSAPSRPSRSALNAKRNQKAGPLTGYDAYGNLKIIDPRFYTEAKPGVAVVPAYGPLAKNLSAWEESCGGGTDINAPQEALRQALAAEDVHAIVFDIDSPGGEVTGIPEFGTLIREAAAIKPVYAFTDAGMCSAAYWLGSQSTELYCTGSAHVGSIGTYLAWLDPSMKMQLEGIQLRLFAEGKHKGLGLPGRPLTEEDEELLRAKVKTINNRFQSAVTAKRPNVKAATMEGQSFDGEEAEDRGLVDGLVTSWDEFLSVIPDR